MVIGNFKFANKKGILYSITRNYSFLVPILLMVVGWMAFFLRFKNFGLYEDDYYFIAPPMGWDFHRLIDEIVSNFVKWPQGRPIGWSLPELISYVGNKIDGISGIYIIAFLIVVLNAFLFYLLLKRFIPHFFAILGALSFLLFPADTTRPFLMHATGLQPSLTFLLIASLCYLSGRKILAFIAIFGCLLTYETPFFVFIGIPLLKNEWNARLIKEIIKNIILLSLMVVIVMIIRYFTGDSRVNDLGLNSTLLPAKIAISILIGPMVTMGLFIFAPIKTLLSWNLNITISFCVCFIVLVIGLFFNRAHHGSQNVTASIQSIPRRMIRIFQELHISEKHWHILKLLLTGIVLLMLGYIASFTHFPPTVYHGRLTSVHLAACIGGSTILVSLFMLAFSIVNQNRAWQRAILFAIILFFSLTAGYGMLIQDDFVQSYHDQKIFWTDVLKIAPDLSEQTIILFEYDDAKEPIKYIHIHSWSDPLVLNMIYKFPEDWQNPPRLFTVPPGWEDQVSLDAGELMWLVPVTNTPAHLEDLSGSNVILLKIVDGKLVRSDQHIYIQNKELAFKSPSQSNGTIPFQKGLLYNLLIGEIK